MTTIETATYTLTRDELTEVVTAIVAKLIPGAAASATKLAYSAEELTDVLGVSLNTVYGLLNSNQIRGRRITARRWRVSHENLMAYLNGADHE